MKFFLTALVVLVILGIGGFFAFKFLKSQASVPVSQQNLTKTLDGVLTPIAFNGEYSEVINVNGQLVGVTSTTLDLKPYENKKVHITGEYSGNTMYADSITVLP